MSNSDKHGLLEKISETVQVRDSAVKAVPKLMHEAYAEGISASDIARAAGVTRGRVHQIIGPLQSAGKDA